MGIPESIDTTEVGVFFLGLGKTETKVEEPTRVGVLVSDADADFTKIKQVADYLFRMLNIEYRIQDAEHSSFIPGRVGRITVGKEKVGYIGEIHPKVLKNLYLDMPVLALIIDKYLYPSPIVPLGIMNLLMDPSETQDGRSPTDAIGS